MTDTPSIYLAERYPGAEVHEADNHAVFQVVGRRFRFTVVDQSDVESVPDDGWCGSYGTNGERNLTTLRVGDTPEVFGDLPTICDALDAEIRDALNELRRECRQDVEMLQGGAA